MSKLYLHNSLFRKKEPFQPLNPTHVRMYACGPTVYNYAHIGNARMAVVFDLWARVLRTLYPKVTYASNITDVDDKIMLAARESGVEISEITEKYTRIYNEDMATLGVQKPDVQPRATAHINDMISLCQRLIENGHAYEAEGHVLFDVPSYKDYGTLSGRSRDEQIAGARVDVAPYKKDPADFVLWKPSKEDEPGWDSPFGYGRPGWHIECSAMAEAHLGLPFDIHGGGADLKFPHHENEIAQSCCAHGSENSSTLPPEGFSKYWVHNGFVTVEGEKMSKSLGNVLLVHDLIKTYPGEALRLTLLSAHYRQPLDWSEDKITQSRKLLDKLYRKLESMADIDTEKSPVPTPILDALCDDLNTPQAFAALNAMLKEENSPELKGALLAVGDIMGILQSTPDEWFSAEEDMAQNSDIDVAEIEALIQKRADAKKNKDFDTADSIRNDLLERGVELVDTATGTTWKSV